MSKRPSLRRHRPSEEFHELNITPIMNLFIILIPFLLISAVFVHIGIIDTSLPIMGGEQPLIKQEKRVFLTLIINNLGFFIKGKESTIVDEKAEKTEKPKKYLLEGELIKRKDDGSYNFSSLTTFLEEIKLDFPKEDTIFILPEPYIKYNTIIKTMDSSRTTFFVDSLGKKTDKTLFPNAIIAANVD